MPSRSASKYKVLHVDDDPSVTLLIGARLKQHGINVTAINDPALAADLLFREHFQVMLLDVDMPGINGLELLDEIKRLDGGINVIMLTGVVSMTTVLKAMRRGASACFFKPMDDVGPLVEAIHAEFDKVDRWWNALKQLGEVKRQEACPQEAHQ